MKPDTDAAKLLLKYIDDDNASNEYNGFPLCPECKDCYLDTKQEIDSLLCLDCLDKLYVDSAFETATEAWEYVKFKHRTTPDTLVLKEAHTKPGRFVKTKK
jgi:hypothetical protein